MTVIPFRRKVTPITWSDGHVQTTCDERVHMFASVRGRCQCGERLWTDPGLPPEGEADPAPSEAGDPETKEPELSDAS